MTYDVMVYSPLSGWETVARGVSIYTAERIESETRPGWCSIQATH